MPEPRTSSGVPRTAMTASDAVWLRDLVRRRSAIVLDESKQYLLDTRLAPLVRSGGFATIGELVARARGGDRHLVDLVVDAMTTNETSWFRDNGPFEALRAAVLPALVHDRAAERRLRIWSAACSSGQEAYSVAMICSEVVPADWTVEIVGTDLSAAMVERAQQGRFSQLEVNRGLPASHLVRWFVRDGSHWQVSPQLKRMTRFRLGNLAQPFTDLGRFDVVMLRNVLIYFDADTKIDILRRTRALTRPDGYLFLGAAETALGMDVGWNREQVRGTSVLRLDGASPTPGATGSATGRPGTTSTSASRPPLPSSRTPTVPQPAGTGVPPPRTPVPAYRPATPVPPTTRVPAPTARTHPQRPPAAVVPTIPVRPVRTPHIGGR